MTKALGLFGAALLAAGATIGLRDAAVPTTGVLMRYDFSEVEASYALPGRLDEVSGLAITPEGRLFAHDDERGRVHEIAAASGQVGKRFSFGPSPVQEDFEGIAIVDERFFLVTSGGWLYEFRESEDRGRSNFVVSDSGVGDSCEVEGLDHDRADDVLVLACKSAPAMPGLIVIHRIPMDPNRARPAPITVRKTALVPLGLGTAFDPSGVVVTSEGTLLVLAGRQSAIIEVDREGAVLGGIALSARRHPQPEGISIGPDGTLFIADEKNDGPARLTTYLPSVQSHSP